MFNTSICMILISSNDYFKNFCARHLGYLVYKPIPFLLYLFVYLFLMELDVIYLCHGALWCSSTT